MSSHEKGCEDGNRSALYLDHYSENLNDWNDEEKANETHEVEIEADYEGMSDYSVSSDSGEDEVFMQNMSTHPFSTTLCPNVMGQRLEEEESHSHTDDVECDICLSEEDEELDGPRHVVYPIHDPTQPWNLMKPVLGMRFGSPKQLKQCLCNYGVANGYQLCYEKNDYKRLLVRCGKGNDNVRCPFRLWASWMGGEESFQIKSLISNHNCSRNFKLSPIVSNAWIGNHFVKELLENPGMSVKWLQAAVMERFNIQLSMSQCRRVKSHAKNEIEGSLTDQYAKLWSYAEEIRRSNPGSTVNIDVETMPDGTNYFSKFYVCFKGVKDGWKEGCRRVIGLDECSLDGIYKGEVLSAVGRDANNHMYPIAWAVACDENKAHWKWFVNLLIDDLSLETGTGLTIISDQHTGLVESVKELLPLAEHRQCARHIYAHFRKRFNSDLFRTLFWKAARSTTEAGFQAVMLEIKRLSPNAYTHLLERNPKSWACDAFENGISERFNSRIERSRKKPILTMLEEIRLIVMKRIYRMQLKGQKWDSSVCPKIRKNIEKLKEQQRCWGVHASGLDQFEVRNGIEAYQVDINEKTCTCRMWQLSGIGCVHSVAALLYLNNDSEKYVSTWLSREMFLNPYKFSISPMNGSSMWPVTEYINPLPPKTRRMTGSPTFKRKRHASEREGRHTINKSGKPVRCGLCKVIGHNRATCEEKEAVVPREKKREPKTKKGKKPPVEKEQLIEEPFVDHVEDPAIKQDVQAPSQRTDPHREVE